MNALITASVFQRCQV